MYDIIIIGAGPAGSSAALFAAKSGKKTLVLDSGQSVTRKAWIRNHYGVMDITGQEMFELGIQQAQQFGAEIVSDNAVNMTRSGDTLHIETEKGSSYESRYVILASGLSVEFAEHIGVRTKPGTEPRVPRITEVDLAGRTNVECVWAAGTCAGVSMHTIVTAGDGAKVAINIISEINGQRYVDHDFKK